MKFSPKNLERCMFFIFSSALATAPLFANVAKCDEEEPTSSRSTVASPANIERDRSAVIYSNTKKIIGSYPIKANGSGQIDAAQRVTVLIAADEEYRRIHSDWQSLANQILEKADDGFIRDHNIDFEVTGYAEWESNGRDAGDILGDLKDEWDDLGYHFVVGLTADKDFQHGGLAYVYSKKPKGSAMSVIKDKDTVDSAFHSMQHELSHNFGLKHHSSGSKTKCIMNTKYIKTVDYWESDHDKQIKKNKKWYN